MTTIVVVDDDGDATVVEVTDDVTVVDVTDEVMVVDVVDNSTAAAIDIVQEPSTVVDVVVDQPNLIEVQVLGGPAGPSGITNVTVDADWEPVDGFDDPPPIGTRILRRI